MCVFIATSIMLCIYTCMRVCVSFHSYFNNAIYICVCVFIVTSTMLYIYIYMYVCVCVFIVTSIKNK